MPIIARFYGILIKMYFKERGVPHFYAIYGEFNVEMVEGDMPARAVKMVKDWAKKYNRDLMDMWKTQKYRQLPGLE